MSSSDDNEALVFQGGRDTQLTASVPVALRHHLAKPSDAIADVMQGTVQNVTRKMQDIRPNRLFEYGVLTGKASMIVVLLLFAFINADTSFVCGNPKYFLSECVIVGACTAVPTIVLAYNRRTPFKDAANAFMIAFLVFFIFNVLMELSGMNSNENADAPSSGARTDREQIELLSMVKSLLWLRIIIGVLFLTMTGLALTVRDWRIGVKTIVFEIVIVAVANSIPPIIIGVHRGQTTENLIITFLGAMLMFGTVSFGLQSGGFFTEVFCRNDITYAHVERRHSSLMSN